MAELSNCFPPLKAISSNLKAHKQKKGVFIGVFCILEM